MLFIWFSFGPDSLGLRASIASARRFASSPGDAFVVAEEEGNPIVPTIRAELAGQGVLFLRRPPARNLNGSRAAVVSIADTMLVAMNQTRQETVWKIDSDTLVFSRAWRHLLELCLCDLVGGDHVMRPGAAALGMAYMIRRVALLNARALLLERADFSAIAWPEDVAITSSALEAGARVNLRPAGEWIAWSYSAEATPEKYGSFDVVSFGNRALIPGPPDMVDQDRRRIAGEAMADCLAWRLARARPA